jgi:hypothetical protein
LLGQLAAGDDGCLVLPIEVKCGLDHVAMRLCAPCPGFLARLSRRTPRAGPWRHAQPRPRPPSEEPGCSSRGRRPKDGMEERSEARTPWRA